MYKKKQTLILKTGGTIPEIAEEFGDFEAWIQQGMSLTANQVATVLVHKGQDLPLLSSISSIVITGSPAMVTEPVDWISRSEAFILSAIDAGIPVLGICFGHQLLAQALGGKVGWHPLGREIGTTDIDVNKEAVKDPVFNGLPECFAAHATHMQTVIKLPEGAKILAANDFEPHHAVRFTEGVWGVQFHPEFDEVIMRRYIEARSQQILEEGLNPDAILCAVRPTPESLQILQNFAHFSRQQ